MTIATVTTRRNFRSPERVATERNRQMYILEHYLTDKSIVECAAHLGIAPATAEKIAWKLGMKRKKPTEAHLVEREAYMRKHFPSPKPVREIASYLSLSVFTVYEIARRLGLTRTGATLQSDHTLADDARDAIGAYLAADSVAIRDRTKRTEADYRLDDATAAVCRWGQPRSGWNATSRVLDAHGFLWQVSVDGTLAKFPAVASPPRAY